MGGPSAGPVLDVSPSTSEGSVGDASSVSHKKRKNAGRCGMDHDARGMLACFMVCRSAL